MRTTVDLPPAVHRRARQLAECEGRSLWAVIADLTVRALVQIDDPVSVSRDAVSGMPIISLGRQITSEDVARAQDEE